MNARPSTRMRSGLVLVLAALAVAPGCVPATRGRPFAIPVPPQLQTVLAVDGQGNQIIAGSFAGTLQLAGGELKSEGSTDIFIVKLDKNRAPVVPLQRFGGKGADLATSVAVDADGSIVLGGTSQGEAAFGEQRLRAAVRHEGQRAVFVARLDPAGKVLWVNQIAVANVPTQVSVAVGPDRNIVVGATATGAITTPNGPMKLAGESVTLGLLSPEGKPLNVPEGNTVRALSLTLGCAHSPCTTGGVLTPGCGPDACVASICTSDPYCCGVEWDATCVNEVTTICQRRCDCGTICTQGLPFYPDACACTAQVCNQDPYCTQTYWDGICVGEANELCHSGCP